MTDALSSLAGRWRSPARVLLAYGLLPNLLVRAIELAARGTTTVCDVDYLVIGLLAPFLGRRTTVVAFVVALSSDLTAVFSPLFHFEMEAVLPSLGELLLARPLVFVLLAIVIVAALVVIALALVRLAPPWLARDASSRALLAVTMALFVTADAVNGSGNLIARRRAFLPVNLAAAPTLQVIRAVTRPMLDARRSSKPVIAVRSATEALFTSLDDSAAAVGSANVALVLIESLGQLKDPHADEQLFSALIDSAVLTHYDVRRATVRFDGPTTAGEFRELCGEQRTYLTAPVTPLPRCLPAQLRARGFDTFSIHGFRRGFFNRASWYPLIGIDSIIDDATIRAHSRVDECGTVFRGPCDADVAPYFTALLTDAPAHQKRFVYWLTLSAHFPVDSRAAVGSSFDCRVLASLAADADVCMLARIWSRDLAAIRAAALHPGLSPTRFIVVGDHAPSLPAERVDRLFERDLVPYVELVPRAAPSGTSTGPGRRR